MGISTKIRDIADLAFLSCAATTKAAGNEDCGTQWRPKWTAEKLEQHCRKNASFKGLRTALAEFEPIFIDP
jgi:hypothetical protein